MNRKLFETMLMAAGIAGFDDTVKRTIRVKKDPQNTKNLFGPISEIAGQELEVLSRNPEGDCLCLFFGKAGKNIVDVDHTDIE